MIALQVEDIREFTRQLFMAETFDRFLVQEARFTTFAAFTVDGRLHQDFFTDEELEQAAERVRQAEASSELAQSVLARKQKVYDDVQGISEQELDSAISAANAAQAQTEAARRAYEEALTGPRAEDIAAGEAQLDALKQQQAHIEFLLSEAVLKAPADGVIRSRMHEPGDMVSPSSAIYKLSILDKKWVRVYVKESDLGRIHEGQSASVTIDSFKDKSIKGQIGYISSTAEFTPKTVQTDELHEDDVLDDHAAQVGIGHGRATVFDDDDLAVVFADIGEGGGQDLRSLLGCEYAVHCCLSPL